jgi:putative ABC transport system permease protein
VLKANKSSSETAGSGGLRNILVVTQFAVSIGLMVCTAIVYRQTLFATQTSAGYDREGLIQFEGMNRDEVVPLRETIIRELGQVPGVSALAGTEIIPAQRQTLNTMVQVPGKSDPEKIGWYAVEPGFFSTMRIPIAAGRPLSRQFANDNSRIPPEVLANDAAADAAARAIVQRGVNIVVNQAAAQQLGFANAKTAVGKQVGLSLFGEEYGAAPATIVGVARIPASDRFGSRSSRSSTSTAGATAGSFSVLRMRIRPR